MSNYSQVTSFTPKDTLPSGNPAKVIRGADFDAEFSAISTAIATKADSSSIPVVTGFVSGPASATDNSLPRFDGTTGKLLQGSGVVVSDTNSFETNVGATYGGYRVKGTSSASNGFELALSSNGVTGNIWLHENAALRFATNNTERMTLDSSGNLTLSSGVFGYGAGAGGTVTQATSKSTSVTLNKPSGLITMNNAAMSAGTQVEFILTNSFIAVGDAVVVCIDSPGYGQLYSADAYFMGSGSCYIVVRNLSGTLRTDAVPLTFAVIKGSRS